MGAPQRSVQKPQGARSLEGVVKKWLGSIIEVLDTPMAQKNARPCARLMSTHEQRSGVELELLGDTPDLRSRDPRLPFVKRCELRRLNRCALRERQHVEVQPRACSRNDACDCSKLLLRAQHGLR